MEYLIAFGVILGLSGPLVWIGDKTGKDILNKIGFSIIGIGLAAIFIYASVNDGGGGAGLSPAELYRR